MPEPEGEAETRRPVTVTMPPSVLQKIDAARGLVSRSAFFELAGLLLADLLEQDRHVAWRDLKVSRERLREKLASAVSASEKET